MKENIDIRILRLKSELRSVHLGPRQKMVLQLVIRRLERVILPKEISKPGAVESIS